MTDFVALKAKKYNYSLDVDNANKKTKNTKKVCDKTV